jgi:hypothetical protein
MAVTPGNSRRLTWNPAAPTFVPLRSGPLVGQSGGGVWCMSATVRFPLGQLVRRIDGADIGTIIGVLLQPTERAIVRWAADTTYEVPDDVIEATQAA